MREIHGVFVDENLLPVGRALSHVGEVLYPGHPHIPELPIGAADVQILKEIGASGRNLMLITRDRRIRTRPAELLKYRQAAVRAVILTGKKDLTPRENLHLILRYWDKTSRLASELGDGPWAVALLAGSGPKELALPSSQLQSTDRGQ